MTDPASVAVAVENTCRQNGLLVSAEEDVIMIFPALTISRATARRGLAIFEKSSLAALPKRQWLIGALAVSSQISEFYAFRFLPTGK